MAETEDITVVLVRPQTSPYREWQEGEGIPIYRGSYVTDLSTLGVAPWARVGQMGTLVNLADQVRAKGK